MTRRDRARSTILRELARAERMRARAIDRLAALAPEAGGGFLLSDELRELLQRSRARFEACHGYRGHAIGFKYVDGHATSTRSITLFVKTKLTERQLRRATGAAAPRWLLTSRGTKIATDVVELDLAPARPAAPRGVRIAPEIQARVTARRAATIRPGASISPDGVDNPGTLACFAWTSSREFVGVTAGHVTDGGEQYVTPPGSGSIFGFLDRERLSPVDAATILVSSAWSQVMPNQTRITGWRELTDYDIGRTRVSLYGAETGTWSTGDLEYIAPWIANWKLADAIIYTSPSLPGDSGGPVIDEAGYLVGVHVGRGRCGNKSVAIANSMARIVNELGITPEF